MQQPLTKRQREVFDFISEQIAANGYAPSLEEIGRRFELSSLATVHKHLVNLALKKYITRNWNRARSITIVPPPEHCQECGQVIVRQQNQSVT